jgi:23S rRNA (pseudouridine1915-N3)-methyltransferase
VKATMLVVGRVKGAMADPIRDYEQRIRHYFSFEAVEVKEESAARGRSPQQVVEAEGERLLARLPAAGEVVALDRTGEQWSSERLAKHLEGLGLSGRPDVVFVIGGAFGLAPAVLERAERRLSLSAMTLPHELARLVMTEQLYRAGTILRGEPYHKTMTR